MTEPTDPTPPPAPPVAAPPRAHGSRRGVLIGAGAAVLALVAGAAVYATTALSGGGRQPDELVPKATFAYLKVDLDPSAGQKLAARSFFAKFPKLEGGSDGENAFEAALARLVSRDGVEYDRDVKPWFDRRAAVAAFPSGDGAAVVTVLRSKDDGKARAALDRAVTGAKARGETLAYRISRGYAVVGSDAGAVGEAVRLSERESLRDNTTYRSDVERIPGDQVAVGWADLGAAFRNAGDAIPYASLVPKNLTDRITGRTAVGLRLDGDFAEVQGLAFGVDPALQRPGSHDLLATLPDGTFAAVSTPGAGAALADGLKGGGGGAFDPASIVAGLLGQAGLSVEDDVVPLLGQETVFALGSAFTGLDTLRGGLLSRVADPKKASEAGPKVAALVGMIGPSMTSTVKGDRFALGTGDYAGTLAEGGALGRTPKFTKAMGDLRGATLAAYVDAEAYVASKPSLRADLAPLRGLGFVAGTRDGQPYFRLRLTVA